MDIAVDDTFARSILGGLRAKRKTISSKWLYDEEGSRLFDSITELPEYYPTRTETAILRERVDGLNHLLPDGTVLVEFGSGSSEKTRLLLDGVDRFSSYVPVEISADYLTGVVERLEAGYPHLDVHPVVADFTGMLALPEAVAGRPKLLFFPGSTIGNFTAGESRALLARWACLADVTAFLGGVVTRGH